MTTKTKNGKKSSFSAYVKKQKENDLRRFYGDALQWVSNQYFTFTRRMDDDNVVILTNNIKEIRGSPVLVVGPNHAVYLKDWQIRRVRNYDEGIETFAVKLNRDYYKVYTFRSPFNDICVDTELSFDDLVAIAEAQDAENMKVAAGWGN